MITKEDLNLLGNKAKDRVDAWDDRFTYKDKPTEHLIHHTRGYLEALKDIEDILDIKEELDGSL